MANNNDAQTKSSPNDGKKSELKSSPKKELTHKSHLPRTQSSNLPNLVSLLAAIALIVALIATYLNFQSRQLNQKFIHQLHSTVVKLKEQQTEIKNHVDATTETMKQSETELQSRVENLSKNLQTAVKQHLYQKQDWLLLKARYYLELAQINAHWSHEQQETIALLRQADTLLMSLPDSRLYVVRQAIAKEIAQLQAQPRIDIAGLLSQLDAAHNTVANLVIKKPFANSESTINTEKATWKAKLHSTMSIFEKLIIVRRNDEDVQPLISPLHQTLLRDSIRLNLQEAQWAILQHNPQVYQLALTRALQEIKRTFDENDSNSKALIKQLQTLLQEKLTAVRPVLEESLPLLNQLIDSQDTNKSITQEGDKTL